VLWIREINQNNKKFWFPAFQKGFCTITSSVADPGCLSRILIFTHPGSKNSNKRDGVKKNLLTYLFCSLKFHKIVNYFIFEVLKKKKLGQYSKNYRTFYPQICPKLSKIWVRGQIGTGSATLITSMFFDLLWYRTYYVIPIYHVKTNFFVTLKSLTTVRSELV
jgi:hypothetical protein